MVIEGVGVPKSTAMEILDGESFRISGSSCDRSGVCLGSRLELGLGDNTLGVGVREVSLEVERPCLEA